MIRIVFAGTPGFAVSCLEALIGTDGVEVVGVVSQPDRKAGRGMKLTPSPVKQAAMDADIALITPEKLRDNDEALAWLHEKAPDILVVVAFGMILPKPWLETAKVAAVNVHASLLPRWRGAAPIERALLAGDRETGISIMQMEEGLDTGAVYARKSMRITDQTTGADLWSTLAPMGAELLIETLPSIMAGLQPEPQPEEGVTYAQKINNSERVIDWSSSADEVDRLVRCFSPRPGVRTILNGKQVKLISGEVATGSHSMQPGQVSDIQTALDIACGGGSIYRTVELQPEGKRAMKAVDFLRGAQLQVGDSFS